VRRELAREFGCDTEEIAVVRNASEAMETLILGLDLRRGDEVVVTTQNYPRMLTAWDQRVRRDGIVLRRVTFAVPPRDPREIVDRVLAAVTPRTRAIELPHITNLTGQVLPIAEIVRRARERGIPVFVDGAHAFAHFPFGRDALGCDFYGTSLHKWLLAPIGTGFLHVRRARIGDIWPLMAAPASMDRDIRKFEEIGTHPQANFNAIAVALSFHRGIGAERKAARLRWLRDRWARPLAAASDRVRIHTPLDDPAQAGAIGFFSVDGMNHAKLGSWLHEKWRIVSTPIVMDEFDGVRVTPNVYTSARECDLLVEAVTQAIRTGAV
jgi:selenocysteine lyase/cysteine desulfurase